MQWEIINQIRRMLNTVPHGAGEERKKRERKGRDGGEKKAIEEEKKRMKRKGKEGRGKGETEEERGRWERKERDGKEN